MTIETTGSAVQGLTQGLAHGLVGNIASNIDGIGQIINVTGDPDGIVTSVVGSQIAYDLVGKELYIADSANGSKWTILA